MFAYKYDDRNTKQRVERERVERDFYTMHSRATARKAKNRTVQEERERNVHQPQNVHVNPPRIFINDVN